MQILIHSSKTMRIPANVKSSLDTPVFLDDAKKLLKKYAHLTDEETAKLMAVSSKKAAEVRDIHAAWLKNTDRLVPAVDVFVGDIYSGLQVQAWSDHDREYAQKHLLILSGLYGALRACDGISPYRLEMGYKLPDGSSLYVFWDKKIANILPASTSTIVNLSAVEYTKALLPFVELPVVTPKFLTISPKTGEPTFVTVHTKIARGAFAGWLIQNRIDDVDQLKDFTLLNYAYNKKLSTAEQPVFVCKEFGGIGLSVRLTT